MYAGIPPGPIYVSFLPCGKVRIKETIPEIIVEIEVMIYNVELIILADLIYCRKDLAYCSVFLCSVLKFFI